MRAEYGEAESRFSEAEVAAQRIWAPKERETELGILRDRQALLARRTGNLEAAQEHITESLELLRRAHGEDSVQIAKAWNSAGAIARDREDLRAAVAAFERAYGTYVRRYGPAHPLSMGAASNLADALTLSDDNKRAYAILSESIGRIRSGVFGSERSMYLALNLDGMSQVLLNLHQPQQALEAAEKAEAIYIEHLGPAHNYRSFPLIHMGNAKLELGRRDEALADLRRAVGLRRQAFGSLHPAVADALQNLGSAYARTGEATAAEPLLRESLDIRSKTLPASSVSIPRTRLLLAESLIKLHRLDDARAQLTAAAGEFRLARDVRGDDREKLSRLDAALVADVQSSFLPQ